MRPSPSRQPGGPHPPPAWSNDGPGRRWREGRRRYPAALLALGLHAAALALLLTCPAPPPARTGEGRAARLMMVTLTPPRRPAPPAMPPAAPASVHPAPAHPAHAQAPRRAAIPGPAPGTTPPAPDVPPATIPFPPPTPLAVLESVATAPLDPTPRTAASPAALPPPAPPPDLLAAYARAVWSLLARFRPPGLAARGTVILRVSVGPAGEVLAVALQHSSGSAPLDDMARDAVRDAGPLPPPPTALLGGASSLTLIIPFQFRRGDR